MTRGSDELLQIAVDGSDTASLDIIKLDDGSVLFVVSERGPVQRRTVVKITRSESIQVAKFIVGMSDAQENDDGDGSDS